MAVRLEILLEEAKHDLFCMDERMTTECEPGQKWNRKQVLGHLVDSALNHHQRVVMSIQEDRVAIASYDQDFWVNVNAYKDRSWEEIISLWMKLNRFLIEIIRYIPADKLSNKLTVGVETEVTMSTLIDDYIRHVRHHLARVVRTGGSMS